MTEKEAITIAQDNFIGTDFHIGKKLLRVYSDNDICIGEQEIDCVLFTPVTGEERYISIDILAQFA